MSTLNQAIGEYLAMRRALGFRLKDTEGRLRRFAAFMAERAACTITVPLALEWATTPKTTPPAESAARLTAVRCFARYRSAIDPNTDIPPWELLPHRPKRARPYLYTEQEIQALLAAALALPQTVPLRRWTYHALLGLLSVSGLRVSEALNLKREDADLRQGLLTIRATKFGKSRLVPLHASTSEVLTDYLARRDRLLHSCPSSYVFVSGRGQRLDSSDVRRTFYRLSRQVGLRGPTDSRGPRLHDFRHRFATNTLFQWYRAGEDVERQLPVLSTYLGHVHVSDTYWYLSAYPQLLGEATRRLEQRWGKQP